MVAGVRFNNLPARGRPGCAPRTAAEPFLPSVITETGLDIHRYICNGWFGSLLSPLLNN